jgi:hypothetical protein
MRHVVEQVSDFIQKSEETSWEGSDDWVRSQFKLYTLAILSCSLNSDKKIWEDFNKSFISQLLSKKYYKHWKESNNAAITNIEPRY